MKNTRVWKIIIIIGALLEMADWWIFDIPILGIIGGICFAIGLFIQAICILQQTGDKRSIKTAFKKNAIQKKQAHPKLPTETDQQ